MNVQVKLRKQASNRIILERARNIFNKVNFSIFYEKLLISQKILKTILNFLELIIVELLYCLKKKTTI